MRKKPKNNIEEKKLISHDLKKSIISVLVVAFALIFLLSLFGQAGIVGAYIDIFLALAFGSGRFVLPFVMIFVAGSYFKAAEQSRFYLTLFGSIVFYCGFLGLLHSFNDNGELLEIAGIGKGGGYTGLVFALPAIKYLGSYAGIILLLAIFVIGFMLAFNFPLLAIYRWIRLKIEQSRLQVSEKAGQQESDEAVEKAPEIRDNIKSIEFVQGPSEQAFEEEMKRQRTGGIGIVVGQMRGTSTQGKSKWVIPPLDLLEENEEKPILSNLDENAEIIKQTLHNFNIEVEKGQYNVGPTVTQYTFKPAIGVKLSRILSLQNDLALALAAHPIRIEAPIPGKSLIGVEVPNKKKVLVRMRTMLQSQEFKAKASNLTIVLGEDVNGEVILGNIERMPHMMIAGSTGTGKSVCINSILTALLYQNSPDQLKMILVDPKRVELSLYNEIPHLLSPVIVESPKVVSALKWAVGEMERRYKLLQDVGCRDIHSYNQKSGEDKKRIVTDEQSGEKKEEKLEKIPFILVVIDELADLMAAHGKEVESLIVRLAQMARAVGIHLIVSTQRPSVEVLTGLIKANITTRIAFQVATQVDSRTILDMAGAEKLLGNGDMLFLSADSARPRRMQGVFISEKEVKKVVNFVKDQAKNRKNNENDGHSISLEQQLPNNSMGILSGFQSEQDQEDELYFEAKNLVIENKKASTSMLQRRLRIGYSRAARLIDMLEKNGVVGPSDGSRAREILTAVENRGSNEQEEQ